MIVSSKRIWMFVLFGVMQMNGVAQEFAWTSRLDSVFENNFYSIPLYLDWESKLKMDLSDIRIKDSEGKIIPFIEKQQPFATGTKFIEFLILKNTTDSASTTLEVDVRGHHGIDHLYLLSRNHAVERTASLSGSNDREQWFIMSEKLPLDNAPKSNDDRFMQLIRFPFARYSFLKFTIKNKGFDPLPVLKAGVYADTSTGEFLELHLHEGTTFRQADSTDGKSYIWMQNQETLPIDRISMVVDGPRFFKRQIQVFDVSEGRKGNLLATGEFRSGKDPYIWLQAGKVRDLLVVIHNGDNPPLHVSAANTQSRRRYLVAYLEKGEQYSLFGGNEAMNAPQYDLNFFKDSVPASLLSIAYQSLVPVTSSSSFSATPANWWIWPSIAVMVGVLCWLTFRLARDVKRREV